MNELLIFLILLLAILLYLLVAPFYIEINSRKNWYGVRFHQLAKAKIYATNESVFIELQIAGWHKVIDLLARKEGRVKKVERSEKKKVKSISISKVRALMASFKLSKCYISLDTGDMALNGILYPWFLWISNLTRKNIQINFYNKNEVELEIKNNFFRVLRAYITH